MSSPNKQRIIELNDAFRRTFTGGVVVLTRGIASLPEVARIEIIALVQSFNDFTEDNDPHGEHDFGSIEVTGLGRVFWKIDYYDPEIEFASDDPADPDVTKRVLTILFASEY